MKKIAFKNFRRFQEFPELELGNISIMVGRNNSGKSTMVKAILLVLDYLQNQQYNEFSFTNKSLEDANIVTFGRAKNNKSESNEIIFDLLFDEFLFSLFIYGNDEDTNANVSKLIITDNSSNFTFEINYNEKIINISKANATFISKSDALGDVMNEFKELGFEIQKPDFKKTSPEGLRMLDQFNKLKDRVQSYYETMEKEHKETGSELFNISYPMKLNLEDKTENSILQEFISDFIFLNDAEIKKLKNIRNNYVHNTDNFENVDDNLKTQFNTDIDEENDKPTIQTLEEKIQELVDLDNYKSDITRSIGNVIKSIKDVQVYYLGANPSKQSALFSIRDKQNNLAQAINDFAQSKILKGNPEYDFVLKWMKEFEVGEDFEIKFYAGEAYEFYVYDKEGNKAHLADKGMGSLQAMMLILRVATIMRKHKSSLKYVTIIVEEPELNLHPALQSKLTRFFHTVNTEYSIEFIIETHSEYLIRQTQLFVAENQYTNQKDLNPNPFKVHYFDVDKGPYEMNYRNDGRFTNEFGTGFFDVNSNLIFDLP